MNKRLFIILTLVILGLTNFPASFSQKLQLEIQDTTENEELQIAEVNTSNDGGSSVDRGPIPPPTPFDASNVPQEELVFVDVSIGTSPDQERTVDQQGDNQIEEDNADADVILVDMGSNVWIASGTVIPGLMGLLFI